MNVECVRGILVTTRMGRSLIHDFVKWGAKIVLIRHSTASVAELSQAGGHFLALDVPPALRYRGSTRARNREEADRSIYRGILEIVCLAGGWCVASSRFTQSRERFLALKALIFEVFFCS